MANRSGLTRPCPLCGEPVSWLERATAEYACLYACVRLVPFPRHLLEKHPDYLAEAKVVAKPIFFTALGLTLVFLAQVAFGNPAGDYTPWATATAALIVLGYGALRRADLIKRYRSPLLSR